MLISALDRKLLRNVLQLGGQLITISLVVASGIAAYTTTRSATTSLEDARGRFYQETRFADVWATVRRAPEAVTDRLAEIDGVATIQTGVIGDGSFPLETIAEPATAMVVSLPRHGARLNDVHLIRGRRPEPGRDEVLLSQAFADIHEFALGDRIPLVVGGVRRDPTIVGIAIGPEHVIVLRPGALSADDTRTGVVWVPRDDAAAALDLVGAFNQVAFDLRPDILPESAAEKDILAEIDRVLARYGGFGAHTRSKQLSHWVLDQELGQLANMTKQVPPLFLLVAAFLLHVVMTRLIQLQRTQIAALKALGYSNAAIGTHFLKLALVIVSGGTVIGLALGSYFASGMVNLYSEYFRFPSLESHLDPRTAAVAVLFSAGTGIFGTLFAVRSVLKLQPAEAMRPPAPAKYRRGLVDLGIVKRLFSTQTRMILREIERKPLRLLFSSVGIAVAVGILVVAQFFGDAMEWILREQLQGAWRGDVTVALRETRPRSATRGFAQIPGVLLAQGYRVVPARARNGQLHKDVSIKLWPDGFELEVILDSHGVEVEAPEDGLMLTAYLAELLDVGVGDSLTLEILEGDRRTIAMPVTALVDDVMGLNIHVRSDVMHAALDQEPAINVVVMRIDKLLVDTIDRRLASMRDVAGVDHKERMVATFREQSARNITVFSLILTLFAATITIGVVYNNARVSLSMRARDLASLRVLGFTRAEISSILLGELAIQVFLAIPIGLWFGVGMSESMATGSAQEMFRLPIVIDSSTFAFATVVTLAAALVSALLVRRKLDKLDLIGVLKTRE